MIDKPTKIILSLLITATLFFSLEIVRHTMVLAQSKFTQALINLNKTVTVEECIKTRQMYPTSHNVTMDGFAPFNPLDIFLKACKEAGK
jgi:hypothetical protein